MKRIYRVILFGLLTTQCAQPGITFFDKSSYIVATGTSVFNNQGSPAQSQIATGTLWLGIPSNITGNKLIFNNGNYTNGDFNVLMTVTYDPANTSSLQMSPPLSNLNFTDLGVLYEKVFVLGTNNTIEGVPMFRTPNPILLGGSAQLTMDTQRAFNQNIVFSASTGIVSFGSNLSFEDNDIITGPGSIQFNNFNLITGKKDLLWTNTLTLINASNLELNSTNKLRGTWNFLGTSNIVGNTFTLDLTGGGVINIARNTTLRMTNVILKGLGSGSIVFTNIGSKLELFNVVLDMDSNFSFTMGTVSAIGPVTAVTRNNFLTFDKRATLTVDRTKFYYDPLSFNDQNNIIFGSRTANQVLLNGGSIQKVRSLIIGDYQIDSNTLLDRDLFVTPLKRLKINQSTTITGSDFSLGFARGPSSPIYFVAAGKKATFTDIYLRGFPVNSSNIVLGDGSQTVFGNGTTVELGENGTLTTTWMFQGSTILQGNGNIMKIGAAGQILVRPGSSLLLNNITLQDVSGSQIRCMDNTSTISFGNVLWNQDGNFTLSNGQFDVIGVTEFAGTSTFVYMGNRTCNITGFGTMCFDEGMAFSYAPRIANRDLIKMETVDSTLCFNNAAYGSTTTGMRLTKGTLILSGKCYQYNAGATALSQGVSFGNGSASSDLTVRFLAQGELNIASGVFVYANQN